MTTLLLDEVAVGQPPRLGPVSLELKPGTLTVVLGPNGSGKSTLLRAIAGLDPLASGRVRHGNANLATMRPHDRASHVAWLPQHARLEEGLSALDVVRAARFRHSEGRSTATNAAVQALASVGAGALAERSMQTLSGGEAQKVRLASLVAQEASWWLLDEPANHLDPAVRLDLADAVTARVAQGGSVLWVSHDLSLLGRVASAHVLVLQTGKVHYHGLLDEPDVCQHLGFVFGLSIQRIQVGQSWAMVPVGRAP